MAWRKLKKIVVVDVESTSWAGEPPPGEESEVIEIGACLLDPRTGERSGRESILVAPRRSSVSEFCTRLTTLRQEDVAAGLPFGEACAALRARFRTKERVWASYGDYDRRMFERECVAEGVEYPFSAGHLNVKTLFALACGLSHEVGMAKALAHLGLPLEGTHHRGADDAWNVAAILAEILRSARAGLGGRLRGRAM
ncbi:MAG: exonuclease domain-containing protein [Planctomycetota bacterium]